VPKIVEVKAVEKPAQAATTAEEENVSWMWPADGKIVASFDESKKGIDIAGKNGQQVVAAGSGKVMYAGSGIRGYVNLVIVKHTSTMLSAYAHNKTILVKEGQIVNKGQQIAEMGSSDADAVKLHFEIRQQGKPVDPSKFLPNR
jgi:lipoprotein NlpD